jgi:hypothetical protein
LLGFHIHVSDDGSSEVVLQIHPDAESMQHHLEVMGEGSRDVCLRRLREFGDLRRAQRGAERVDPSCY